MFDGYRVGEADDLFTFTPEQYQDGLAAGTHGTANPSLMNKPYWKYLIRHGLSAWSARRSLAGNSCFADIVSETKGPEWCFQRFGSTFTKLPDGRLIIIGGEHEDFYDPDFYIYNGEC